MGLRLGLMRGNRGGGAAADFTVSLTNLTSGEARNGATIGVNIPELVGGEVITYQWTDNGSNISGATSSTFTVNIGTNMTDGQTLRCVATIDGTPYTSNGAPARYAPGTASSIADGQTFNTATPLDLDASASGTGLTWTYAATGLPADGTINTSTGAITGDVAGAGSGTASITHTDQYGRLATGSPDTFTWTAVASVNPAISSDSFTASGSGNPAVWTVEGSYAGADTLVLEGVTGTDPISVSAAQLTAGSGGTNTLEFFTIDPFTFSSNNDLTGLTSTSESATRIAYQVREKNNGGTSGVQTPADVISGLDYTVPAWGSGITAASSVDGLSIVLTSSEALYLSNDFADWTVAGAASTPSVNAISGSGTTSITLTLSAAIANGETITLDFADTDTNLRDAAGNAIGDIGTPISVTNNVPASGFTDDFNRADETLETSSQWTRQYFGNLGQMAVASNQLSINGNTNAQALYTFEETLANDQYAQLEYVGSTSGNREISVRVRWTTGTNSGNGYEANYRISDNVLRLRRVDNGSFTTLGSDFSITATAGDVFRVKAVGTTISVEYDSGSGFSTVISQTDATHSSGKAGIYFFKQTTGSGIITADNWEAGDA